MPVFPDEQPASFGLPWNVTTRDVVMDRVPIWDGSEEGRMTFRKRFNLGQVLWPIGRAGFGWGEFTERELTLALNILDRFIGRPNGETCSYYGRALACHPLCTLLMSAFAVDFLAPLPFWGGVLAGPRVAAWIADRRQGWELDGIDLVSEGARSMEIP